MNELIKLLEEQYTPAEIIELLNSINKFYIDDYAIEHDICPFCGGELVIYKYKERRPDYWGFPAWEEMCNLMCSGCGEIF